MKPWVSVRCLVSPSLKDEEADLKLSFREIVEIDVTSA